MFDLRHQFEQLLNDGPADVFEFLSAHADAPNEEQLSVVLLDLKRRWEAAVPISVEVYLHQLPHLREADNAVVALATAEFEAQSNAKTNPSREEFAARFPEVADRLGFETAPPDATQAFLANTVSIDRLQPVSTRVAQTQTLPAGILRDRYRLIRLLGAGSFGQVYLAVDSELEREVAIKVPTSARFQNSNDGELYLSEARTVAGLVHPNIVPVYDTGKTSDGAVFVVSRFINGETLESRLRKSILTANESAKLLKTIAEALAYAHDRRLIHRDVKPANILIETATNTAFITDFGLAVREEDYTKQLGLAGTYAYMSPEQARGEGHRLDGRSDVFALGIILYEMLTGQRPFRGNNANEILHQVIAVEPQAPRSLRPEIPAELERICSKALCKSLADRYANATALAEDLDAWLLSKPSSSSRTAENELITPKGLRSFDAGDAGFFVGLLPGLRNRHGVPESIAFWQQRIEETAPEQTFSVGLIYGPSGCGKSSLVKAGLLPLLSSEIVAIYIEASPGETELRIARRLRNSFPGLAPDANLPEMFTAIRLGNGPKVVVILDQFEQWLHAHGSDTNAELANALRQCDGGRLQAILMVRDDFYVAASRLMRWIDIPILQGDNCAMVDLFDLDHTKKVLVKFGQAYGKIPLTPNELSEDHLRFVEQVSSGLAIDGKVVPVRLSLFCDMVKGKEWLPVTLAKIGGTQGVGVSFLEETFGIAQANARYRRHMQAASGVLKSLMPALGTDIKGNMRSLAELKQLSGYQDRPEDFNELLRILDSELRLITPTDAEGGDGATSHSLRTPGVTASDPSTQNFQLTHDYLVPSLRTWLTRKQRETRKGRAELKLAERSSAWSAVNESKQLPTLTEWLSILVRTNKADWTEPQRKLMQATKRYHFLWASVWSGAISLVVIGIVVFMVLFGWYSMEARRDFNDEADAAYKKHHTEKLVKELIEADTDKVEAVLKQIYWSNQAHKWDEAVLVEKYLSSADDSDERLRLSLAMVETRMVDENLEAYLWRQLMQAEPSRIPFFQGSLGRTWLLNERSWEILCSRDPDPNYERLHAAASLAACEPTAASWEPNLDEVANQLATVDPIYLHDWLIALRPIHEKLLTPLRRIQGDSNRRPAERAQAAKCLSELGAQP